MSALTSVSPLEYARAGGTLAAGWSYITWHAVVRRDPLMQLFTWAGRRDRYALYERLREQGSVVTSTTGFRAVVGHAAADQVLRSRDVSVVTSGGGTDTLPFDLSLLELDPPDHTRLRALVAPAFTARRMAVQEDRIRAAVDRFTDELAGRLADGPVDLMEAFARPLPVLMITSLLGIPDDEVEPLTRYGNAVGLALDGVQSLEHHRALKEADAQLRALFERLVERRRRDPGDDLVSHLVAAEGEGRLTHAELLPLASLLLVAGFETTVNLVGNAVAALLDRPDLWRRVTDDPGLAERAVDETLRQDPPVQLTGRTPTRDLVLDGHAVPAGTGLVVLLGAANRDPDVFERPAEFDLDRPNPRDHLAFSSGIHHCVGRPLAELEGRLALEALATRLPRLVRAGRETMASGVVLHGRRTLPVKLAGPRR